MKQILTACSSPAVAEPLAADLAAFAGAGTHDELAWKDVAVHACRVLAARDRAVFVTPFQTGTAAAQYAAADGYRLVVVPEHIARALRAVDDIDGHPIRDLRAYQREFNESFRFDFVDPAALTDPERALFETASAALDAAGVDLAACGIDAVVVSETMRLDAAGFEVVGLCDFTERRIVIRRDQLAEPALFLGTLLHEAAHAASRTADGTLEFEHALTERLGATAVAALVATDDLSTEPGRIEVSRPGRDG